MAKYVWQGKAHARADGSTVSPREEFEPTDEEIRSFGDLMKPVDKESKDAKDAPEVVTSTPNPDVPDVPQKGMLHRPPLEEDGTEPEDMPKQVYHRMHPAQRVPKGEEAEPSSRRVARRSASGTGEESKE